MILHIQLRYWWIYWSQFGVCVCTILGVCVFLWPYFVSTEALVFQPLKRSHWECILVVRNWNALHCVQHTPFWTLKVRGATYAVIVYSTYTQHCARKSLLHQGTCSKTDLMHLVKALSLQKQDAYLDFNLHPLSSVSTCASASAPVRSRSDSMTRLIAE